MPGGYVMDEMKHSPIDSLKKQLSDQGPISIADYMALSLTAADVGYYKNGNPIGAAGDFVTAPEVSQIFGELIAVWAMIVWEGMGCPENFILGELGPGDIPRQLHAGRTTSFTKWSRIMCGRSSSSK